MQREIKFRNLSGIYFREEVNGKWENICFEELSEEKQDKILSEKDPEFIKNLTKILAKTIVELGEQFDLQKD